MSYVAISQIAIMNQYIEAYVDPGTYYNVCIYIQCIHTVYADCGSMYR